MLYMKSFIKDIFGQTSTPNYFVNLNFCSLVHEYKSPKMQVDILISIFLVALYCFNTYLKKHIKFLLL